MLCGWVSLIMTENDWDKFNIGARVRPLREFPNGKWLHCLSLLHVHSLVKWCGCLYHTFSILKFWAFCLDYLYRKKKSKNIVPSNKWLTISFKMTLFSRIKTSIILIFLKISRISPTEYQFYMLIPRLS